MCSRHLKAPDYDDPDRIKRLTKANLTTPCRLLQQDKDLLTLENSAACENECLRVCSCGQRHCNVASNRKQQRTVERSGGINRVFHPFLDSHSRSSTLQFHVDQVHVSMATATKPPTPQE
ncbi:hypothetical protein GN956_G23088 [Arapaima gigas]